MKKIRYRLVFLLVAFGGLVAIFSLPQVQDRAGWRIAELLAQFKYAISPPEEVVFVPQQEYKLPVKNVSATAISIANNTVTITPSSAGPSFPTPTQTFTPIPSASRLTGFRHEYQTWNNCGPATLGIALSFWGWKGNQQPIATYTKPNPRDKNVMPYELISYVEEKTQFEGSSRVGGNLGLLKRFLAIGIPVIIEKGFEGPKLEGWMGHYVLVTGYDDSDKRFILQDSFYGPDQSMLYADLETYWRAFNFRYIVVYPAERNEEAEAILGPYADEQYSYRSAAQVASSEIYTLTGRDQFFAWFNRGTSLVQLQDYSGAAEAYDRGFELYPTIPEKDRPWRMMWYQTGPYWAYYYTGRYQDVINLATKTLDAMSEPVLEESYYWRALARQSLGDDKGAGKDLRSSLAVHPGFEPALALLEQTKAFP